MGNEETRPIVPDLVRFFQNCINNRFKEAKEKMLGEVVLSEDQTCSQVKSELLPTMERHLGIIFKRYPDLNGLFDATKAGFNIQFDRERSSLDVGFNHELNNILLWVSNNPDKYARG